MSDLTESTRRVTVTALFYDDHVSRDLDGGVEVKRTKLLVTVDLTDVEWAELLSDADYYAGEAAAFGPDFAGICSSAKITARRMRAAEVARAAEVVDESPTRCDRCGAGVTLMASGNWSTGFPSHLAITCDGIHLHQVAAEVAR